MPVEENFRQSFQTDYGKIEDELREYIEKRSFPILNIKFPNQLDLAKELQSAQMSEAEVMFHLGDLLLRSNRLDEAEENLKKSIALDPKFAASQVSMGILRLRQDQTAEAKKMFEAAMALDPRNYLAHSYYARLLREEGKHEEALKSYKEAARLKPELTMLHAELGFTYLSLGRDREANEAFRQVTSRKQNDSLFYMDRSHQYLRASQGAHAAAAAFIYLIQQGWRDSHSPYMALSAHFGHRQARRDADAARILKEAIAKTDASEWPHPVLRYLQRDISAAQLLALATDNNKQTEAYAYIGLDLSLSGNRDAAITHLRWVRDKGNKNFYEYPLALAELARLEGSAGSAP
jgi:tetratricopeptide (TPR) repeat protein